MTQEEKVTTRESESIIRVSDIKEDKQILVKSLYNIKSVWSYINEYSK